MAVPAMIHWDAVATRHVRVGSMGGAWAEPGRADRQSRRRVLTRIKPCGHSDGERGDSRVTLAAVMAGTTVSVSGTRAAAGGRR